MIQRIQTVFLFLAVIALVLFNIFPYWQSVSAPEGEIINLMSYAFVHGVAEAPDMDFGLYSLVAAISGVAIILLIIEIFSNSLNLIIKFRNSIKLTKKRK